MPCGSTRWATRSTRWLRPTAAAELGPDTASGPHLAHPTFDILDDPWVRRAARPGSLQGAAHLRERQAPTQQRSTSGRTPLSDMAVSIVDATDSAPGGIRTHTGRCLRPLSLPLDYRGVAGRNGTG